MWSGSFVKKVGFFGGGRCRDSTFALSVPVFIHFRSKPPRKIVKTPPFDRGRGFGIAFLPRVRVRILEIKVCDIQPSPTHSFTLAHTFRQAVGVVGGCGAGQAWWPAARMLSNRRCSWAGRRPQRRATREPNHNTARWPDRNQTNGNAAKPQYSQTATRPE